MPSSLLSRSQIILGTGYISESHCVAGCRFRVEGFIVKQELRLRGQF
jgi:hypothetical protein